MRNLQDIEKMSEQDYSCGIIAHYKPLTAIVDENNLALGLEVGTAYGNNAEYLLKNTGIVQLYCVDPYKFYPAMPGFVCQEEYDILYRYTLQKLHGYYNFMSIFRMDSKKAFQYLDDRGYVFDFIFLDGDHEYETVKWEGENYKTLLRKGGILCGHDYNIFEGVNKAVDELRDEWNLALTLHDGNIWSFKL